MQVKEKVHLEEVQKVLTDFQTQVSEQLQTLYDDVGKQLKETKMKQDLDQTRESAEEVREMVEKLRHEDSKFR
jgi:flagellin-specific chaperone FliS